MGLKINVVRFCKVELGEVRWNDVWFSKVLPTFLKSWGELE